MSDLERCHLGDVCGEPYPAQFQPLYWPTPRPHWIQRLVRVVLYASTGVIIAGLVLAWLSVMVFFSPLRALEMPTDPYEKRVFLDCYADAVKFCRSSFLSGRMAIISCMVQRKAQLRPNCSRHLYDNEERKENAIP
jgi:hypothetical protein